MSLIFDVKGALVDHVKYRRQRIIINEARAEGEDTTSRLLTTKYIEWLYEHEAHVFKSIS